MSTLGSILGVFNLDYVCKCNNNNLFYGLKMTYNWLNFTSNCLTKNPEVGVDLFFDDFDFDTEALTKTFYRLSYLKKNSWCAIVYVMQRFEKLIAL